MWCKSSKAAPEISMATIGAESDYPRRSSMREIEYPREISLREIEYPRESSVVSPAAPVPEDLAVN